MNQEIRNKLRNVVTQCRRLLEESVSQELEGKYVIFAKKDQVTAAPNAKMTHLTEEEQAARRDILDHFEHIKARGFKPREAFDQLVREIAFTNLNRLCAYKMMEARDVYVGGQKFREAVSRGVNSNGVKFYLADHPEDERLFNTGHQDIAYRHFLDWLGGFLSDEIGVLFNPNDPANRLYPRQKTLDEVLELLNGGGIKPEETELREEWPKIWLQDETIGWVYQYFTPKELRDAARDPKQGGSQAPRNSYELAFRNQFFTPRYVVEFLTDNTLGRIWYEMRKGDTKLKDLCRYMVRRPIEIFLNEGQQSPEDVFKEEDGLSQEKLLKLPVHILHRPKKDPRELKILDPASGSGHFLLYCFDLLVTIYDEAYIDPELGPALHNEYPTLEDLRRHVPQLILAHNLHGIDIDVRASQIAALALWLRCQSTYQDMGLKKDRPKITRSNLVCAEPMPGEELMLKEFVGQLEPKFLGQVVEVVFDKMKLAGEAGSLLKIEEKIREAVASAKKQWARETAQAMDRKGQPLLFTQTELDRIAGKPGQVSLFDLSDITDKQFFEQAEAKVIKALRQYAEKAQNGQRLQRRLFAEDVVRGFAFVDLLQKQYDVILMNPPFGEPTVKVLDYFRQEYPAAADNLLIAFIMRFFTLLSLRGKLAAITDRSFVNKRFYETFRREFVASHSTMELFLDLGWGVLDANVEVAAHVHSEGCVRCEAANISGTNDRAFELLRIVSQHGFAPYHLQEFSAFPGFAFAFDLDEPLARTFAHGVEIGEFAFTSYGGLKAGSSDHLFRLAWEVPAKRIGPDSDWALFQNGSPFSPYYYGCFYVVRSDASSWHTVLSYDSSRITNHEHYFKPAISYGKRTEFMYGYKVRSSQVPSMEGHFVLPCKGFDFWQALAIINSSPYQHLINYLCGQHKYAGYINPARIEVNKFSDASESCRIIVRNLELMDTGNESSAVFTCPLSLRRRPDASFDSIRSLIDSALQFRKEASDRANQFRKKFNETVESALGWTPRGRVAESKVDYVRCLYEQSDSARLESASLISYFTGVGFGRWDIRYALRRVPLDVGQDDFSSPPFYQPGTLVDPSLAPCTAGNIPSDVWIEARSTIVDSASSQLSRSHTSSYPARIAWDGIIPDDPEHAQDIVVMTRQCFEIVFGSRGDQAETELLDLLEHSELRGYFRSLSKGGFWGDHLSRYSKGRRSAPIYWLLQSSMKNYALWFYYHRLDKDLLFKALVNYVEPKIRIETSRFDTLRLQKVAVGETGKESKRLAKEVEQQEAFISELRDFEDKLRRAADLHLEPDLNDGVVLNIAPLRELVPWNEAEDYWQELLAGKYEWSSIGKQLRQKGLVK